MYRLKLFAVAVVLCSTGVIYAAGDGAKHNAKPRVANKAGASCCAQHKAARQEAKGQASEDSCCKSGASCCGAGASCCANHKASGESNDAAASCPADGSGKDCCAGGGSCCDGGSCCKKRAA
jgi:hypothetical protein